LRLVEVVLEKALGYSEDWVLIDAILAHIRRLAEAGHIRLSLHASQRALERGIEAPVIRESIVAGDFRYVRHELGKRGDITVRIKCSYRQTGTMFTAQLAVAPGFDYVYVLSVWD
jgi:hypothetical protein